MEDPEKTKITSSSEMDISPKDNSTNEESQTGSQKQFREVQIKEKPMMQRFEVEKPSKRPYKGRKVKKTKYKRSRKRSSSSEVGSSSSEDQKSKKSKKLSKNAKNAKKRSKNSKRKSRKYSSSDSSESKSSSSGYESDSSSTDSDSSSTESSSSSDTDYDLTNYDSIKGIYKAYIQPCMLVSIFVVLVFIANLLFENSLTACNYDVIVCIKWLKSKMIPIIVQIVAFAFIHFAVAVASLYQRVCYVRWFGLFLVFVSYGYRIMTSKGFGNVDHSKANMMISEVILIVMTAIWTFWWITFKLWFWVRPRRKGYRSAQKLTGGNQAEGKFARQV